MNPGQMLWIRHAKKAHYRDQQTVMGVAGFSTRCRPG